MNETIKYHDKYYILASSSIVEEQNHILKDDETCGIFNISGDIRPFCCENQGIFYRETRYLSRMLLRIENMHPVLLSSSVKYDNQYLIINMTNPDFIDHAGEMIEKDILHIKSTIFIKDRLCCRKDHILNFGSEPYIFHISYTFDADFLDIFELRGIKREKHGTVSKPSYDKGNIIFSYNGLDNIKRQTEVSFSITPDSIEEDTAKFKILTYPKKSVDIGISVAFREGIKKNKKYLCIKDEDIRKNIISKIGQTLIETSSKTFNRWINRSSYDILMMLSQTSKGYYPFAGVPWFNTVFGRDGIITALMTLWLYPEITRGVLSYLSLTQGESIDENKESEPGKIIHEQRKGEMANLGEVPFREYYGAIDTTPLFIVLCGYYLKRTGDEEFIKKLWPSINKAITWIDKYGDVDGDGFIEYENKSSGGLSQRGWRDSWNAIYHRNGEIPSYPIALSEVQGYVYEAKIQAAFMARFLGKKDKAENLDLQAEKLRQSFEIAFWDEKQGFYYMALDGNKKPCNISCSSTGHNLFTGILTDKKAHKVIDVLLGKSFYTGWGIRTVAETEPGYNPMSYHNGTIWPHDNALIAYGMSRYGCKYGAVRIANSMFEASQYMEKNRMPELFCGFKRDVNTGPILYPSSCSPQSWAAASVFSLMQACIGIDIDTSENIIYLDKPRLPAYLNFIRIRNLNVNGSCINLNLCKKGKNIEVFTSSEDNIKIIVKK